MSKDLKVPQFQATTSNTNSPLYSMIHNEPKKHETIKTCLAFDKDLFTKIKIYAAKHGTTITALISSHFEDLISKEND
ncbi:MAG: hypothetical protein MJZ20_08785 [Bacteroidaceae bacterium]|nr:hypothetical protein [Bacteroidaceae bacterium]